MHRIPLRQIVVVFILLMIAGCKPVDPTVLPEPMESLENEEAISQDEDQPVSQKVDPTAESLDPTTQPDNSSEPEIAGSPTPVDELASQLQGLSLDEFFETSFAALVKRSPESVLADGLEEHYGMEEVLLDDISDEYQRETYAMASLILEMLEDFDRDGLSPEDQISYDIYQWYLEDFVSGLDYMYYDYPATYFFVTSVHESLLQFFTDLHPVASTQDARDYVTRLGQVGVKIDQLIDGLERRNQAGITPPEFAIQWTVYGNLGSFVDKPARVTSLYTTFKGNVDLLSSGTPEENQAILDEAEQTIDMVVIPAYKKLHQYLSQLPTYPGSDSGVWRLPEGDAYYTHQLRHFTTTDLSADEIHQLGMDELARIHAEMRVIFDQLGYPQDETVVEAYDRVARDGGHVQGSDVLNTYETIIADARQNLDAAFNIFPKAEVIVIGGQTGGYYVSGSFDGSRPGAFYAAVGGSGEDYYAMPTLAYHESIPGHHTQIALAQEMEGLPSFRRGVGFTAFAEGWALYAEQLAADLGWYEDDPYGYLGFLQAQAFRAARLVVDTGLHAKGWTFDQAQEFFTENTGFEVGDSVHPGYQIARYLVMPGQSTSYYVGYMKIMELRQRAMDQLGDQFDLKEFHRVMLSNGSMPLELLERVIDRYIDEKMSGG